MNTIRRSKSNIGAWLWVASLQFYIAQLIVAVNWGGSSGYSLRNNTISDLGNTMCGVYGGRDVCSPPYILMNSSFVLFGCTMLVASWVLISIYKRSVTRFGLLLLACSGFGTILVGLFPENGVAWPHVTGAALAFIGGNVALLCFGFSKEMPLILRVVGRIGGAIGLLTLVLFVMRLYGPLGLGGIERFVAYPQSIWMIVAGLVLLRTRATSGTIEQ